MVPRATTQTQITMEATDKEVIEKKVYVHDNEKKEYASKGVAGTALGLGIAGTALALWGRGNGLGIGGQAAPENVNINATGGSSPGSAPTAFQSWEKACDDRIALTNEMWGLKMNTMTQMYDHRQADVAEKFSLWKGQVDADFALYKSNRDSYDSMMEKLNAASFGLYKEQRDNYDRVNARIAELETKVAVGSAVRPYQDRLLQCEIDRAYTASVNYTDRKTCRALYGVVGLPSTPTVSVLEGANPYGCDCARGSRAAAQATA